MRIKGLYTCKAVEPVFGILSFPWEKIIFIMKGNAYLDIVDIEWLSMEGNRSLQV